MSILSLSILKLENYLKVNFNNTFEHLIYFKKDKKLRSPDFSIVSCYALSNLNNSDKVWEYMFKLVEFKFLKLNPFNFMR